MRCYKHFKDLPREALSATGAAVCNYSGSGSVGIDCETCRQGSMLWFLKHFRKKWRFLTPNTASLDKNWIETFVFKKKRQFFRPKVGENRRK
jgi:hypothetical protein